MENSRNKNMKDAGTRIMAAGLVEEGMKFEEMEKKISLLESKLKLLKPVCPACLTEMEPTEYQGYYDSFSCWMCDCENLDGAVTLQGDWA
jgi:tRNA(Ile2) C34 agmatinyltransferase TiaS